MPLHPVQKEIFKKMTAEEKLNASMRLYWSARHLKAAAIRKKHPDWDEEKVQETVKEIFMYART
ncbi:MAG: hypothetical protein QNK37_02255 [Acidobacteriota bacterium]|nr:hypothetical protein [Acidobacteriota bacterium]